MEGAKEAKIPRKDEVGSSGPFRNEAPKIVKTFVCFSLRFGMEFGRFFSLGDLALQMQNLLV